MACFCLAKQDGRAEISTARSGSKASQYASIKAQIVEGTRARSFRARDLVADLSCPDPILNTVINIASIVAFDDEIACRASSA